MSGGGEGMGRRSGLPLRSSSTRAACRQSRPSTSGGASRHTPAAAVVSASTSLSPGGKQRQRTSQPRAPLTLQSGCVKASARNTVFSSSLAYCRGCCALPLLSCALPLLSCALPLLPCTLPDLHSALPELKKKNIILFYTQLPFLYFQTADEL